MELRQALSLSVIGHVGLMIFFLLVSVLFEQGAGRDYPASYRVNIISLPHPAEEATSEAALTEAPQATPESKPTAKPKPAQTKPSQSRPPVPSLPKGMKVVSVEGMTAEGSYYLGLILQKISQHWRNPYQGQAQQIRTQVYFRLNSDGELLDVQLEKPSGDGPFDQAALRAVYLARPFPPFTPEMKLKTLGVHFEFEYIK